MGYDQRVASSLIGLGYDFLAFEAFDETGHIVIPDRVQYPTGLRDAIGKICVAPVWADLYRTLSVLQNPVWSAYATGIGYSSRTINVTVYKAVSSVRNTYEADQWVQSYNQVISRTLRKFAGTHYTIDPKWLSWLNQAVTDLPASEKTGDAADSITPSGLFKPTGENPPTATSDAELTFAVPWLLFGLRAVIGLLQNFTVRTGVRSTVIWYGSGGQVIDLPFASRWIPIHKDYMLDGAIRTLNVLWEPDNRLPHIITGNEVQWNRPFWSMPNQPWELCRAMYPTLQCGGPGLVGAPDCIAAVEAEPGTPSGIESDGVPAEGQVDDRSTSTI